jgi:uncharacterized membrane protein YphA (DoxX/SURF4 family)
MEQRQDFSTRYAPQALTLLRVAIGIFLIYKGLGKVAWFADSSLLAARLHTWLENATALNEWYLNAVIPAVPVFARLVPFGELGGGLALILGVWTRPVAALVLLMVLNFHVATAAVFEWAFLGDGQGPPLLAGLVALAMAGPVSGIETALRRALGRDRTGGVRAAAERAPEVQAHR